MFVSFIYITSVKAERTWELTVMNLRWWHVQDEGVYSLFLQLAGWSFVPRAHLMRISQTCHLFVRLLCRQKALVIKPVFVAVQRDGTAERKGQERTLGALSTHPLLI